MRSAKAENSPTIPFYHNVNPRLSNDTFFDFRFFVAKNSDLTGCADGSVFLLNWSTDSAPRQVREPSKRVTKVELNNEGNKVCRAFLSRNRCV